MIRVKRCVVGELLTNCYLLINSDSREALIIDPGDDPAKILGVLEPGLSVKAIIATHCHFDHILAVEDVREALGAKFQIHRDDLPILEEAPRRALEWAGKAFDAPSPDGYISEGEEIALGNSRVKVLHTPGHSPGSVCLLVEDVLFSGDTLFAGSVGRTDLYGGDYDQLLRSIKEKLCVLSDDTRVMPGHGESTRIGVEKLYNPFVKASLRHD
jgi:glyoxylase-like metal-dependent hydrolase (beta-lactamase superfamily II)